MDEVRRKLMEVDCVDDRQKKHIIIQIEKQGYWIIEFEGDRNGHF